MIETCDPNIASWTEDGEMFTIKNPDLFASEVCKKKYCYTLFNACNLNIPSLLSPLLLSGYSSIL
jgi:hypothetical protein